MKDLDKFIQEEIFPLIPEEEKVLDVTHKLDWISQSLKGRRYLNPLTGKLELVHLTMYEALNLISELSYAIDAIKDRYNHRIRVSELNSKDEGSNGWPPELIKIAKEILKESDENGNLKEIKVESKFHEGDWITDGHIHCKITEILDDRYIIESKFSKKRAILFEDENRYHLWTIADAIEGDVLAWDNSKCIALFKDIYNEYLFNSYGFVGNCTGSFEPNQRLIIEGTHPATKEQRDLLSQKMKKAGYEWTGKKMLKKIGVISKENKDEKMRKAILTGLIDCRDAPDLGWSNFGGININDCIAWLEKSC